MLLEDISGPRTSTMPVRSRRMRETTNYPYLLCARGVDCWHFDVGGRNSMRAPEGGGESKRSRNNSRSERKDVYRSLRRSCECQRARAFGVRASTRAHQRRTMRTCGRTCVYEFSRKRRVSISTWTLFNVSIFTSSSYQISSNLHIR